MLPQVKETVDLLEVEMAPKVKEIMPKPWDWTEPSVWLVRPQQMEVLPLSARPINPLLGCADYMQKLRTPLWNLGTDHHLTAAGVTAAYTQFTAGAVGGGTATYCTHWLDTIKVKMQTFPDMYESSTCCLRDTLRQEGVRGLYQGATPAMLGSAAKASIVFTLYGLSDELVRRVASVETTDDLRMWHHASSGAMTGMVTSVVLCPLELVKCRQQANKQLSQTSGHKLSSSCMVLTKEVIRSDGARGLFRGLTSMWAKDIPGSFVYFGSYECAKSIVRNIEHTSHLGTAEVFLCGVAAGMCYCIMHPVDAIKTRVQVMSAVDSKQASGFIKPFINVLRSEGIAPLFSGLKPSMIRACLYSGIQFMAYETVKEMLMERHKHSMMNDINTSLVSHTLKAAANTQTDTCADNTNMANHTVEAITPTQEAQADTQTDAHKDIHADTHTVASTETRKAGVTNPEKDTKPMSKSDKADTATSEVQTTAK